MGQRIHRSRRFDPQALTSLTPFPLLPQAHLLCFDPQALTSLTFVQVLDYIDLIVSIHRLLRA